MINNILLIFLPQEAIRPHLQRSMLLNPTTRLNKLSLVRDGILHLLKVLIKHPHFATLRIFLHELILKLRKLLKTINQYDPSRFNLVYVVNSRLYIH